MKVMGGDTCTMRIQDLKPWCSYINITEVDFKSKSITRDKEDFNYDKKDKVIRKRKILNVCI